MVEINLTLLVQVINFALAYIVLRNFFFKPIVEAIQKEDQEKESLIDTIEQRRVMLEEREKERQMQWRKCQTYFVKQAPVFPSRTALIAKSPLRLISSSFDPKTIEEYSTFIADDIVQKVRHVR
jgi:hypothetical protein